MWCVCVRARARSARVLMCVFGEHWNLTTWNLLLHIEYLGFFNCFVFHHILKKLSFHGSICCFLHWKSICGEHVNSGLCVLFFPAFVMILSGYFGQLSFIVCLEITYCDTSNSNLSWWKSWVSLGSFMFRWNTCFKFV